MDRFALEGITYYSQTRTCSKPNCACQTDPDRQHGPYWYKRDGGKVSYIGKHLPAHIERARAKHALRRPEMAALKEKLQDQVSSLHAHLGHNYISPRAREILIGLGFGDTLTATDAEVYGPDD